MEGVVALIRENTPGPGDEGQKRVQTGICIIDMRLVCYF